MAPTLPNTAQEFAMLPWQAIAPFYHDLQKASLTASNVESWLREWTRLHNLLSETNSRLSVATTIDTTDKEAEIAYDRFLDEIFQASQNEEQKLKEKLIASGLDVAGFEVPLRNMKAEADLFSEANVPLLAEQIKLSNEYDQLIGGQNVEWDGKEVPVAYLNPVFEEKDRSRREKAWRTMMDRKLQDRASQNALWVRFFELRQRIAANAGKPSFRDYMWQHLLRFDYTPEDCAALRDAIEKEVVPAATRIYEKRRKALGLETLRPWDTDVDLSGEPLRPFQNVSELVDGGQRIFDQLDPELGQYYRTMVDEDLLDLDSRKGKAPGGYCTDFNAAKRPFIFMNAVGTHDDVQTLLHEAGHAFHVFETVDLPYFQQLAYTSEIAEVASMSMELLCGPYLTKDKGGYYTPAEAARARIKHLERSILFWPYMSVVDGFQHWAYENPSLATDSARCDTAWGDLWQRFMPGVDWSGLEDVRVTGWHRKLHIFQVPFYYVEYGLAQLGALQVWRNSQQDAVGALESYRRALSLGGTRPLPELYAAAGAKFSFDSGTIGDCVSLMEKTIEELSST